MMKTRTSLYYVAILISAISGCHAGTQPQTIQLMPNQGKMPCNVVTNLDGKKNIFALTIPETIGCREGMLLNFPETDLAWEGPDADGVVRTGWTKDSVISYSLELVPGRDFVDAVMVITNLSKDNWEDVWSFNCLNPVKAPAFRDEQLDRTYMSTPAGPKPLSATERTIGPRPGIGVYFSERMGADEYWPFISGFQATSPERTNGDYLLTMSSSGHTYMAATSPRTLYLFNNLEFTCIHAAPTFGDIPSGGTSSLTCRFYLAEGDMQDFFQRFKRDLKKLGN